MWHLELLTKFPFIMTWRNAFIYFRIILIVNCGGNQSFEYFSIISSFLQFSHFIVLIWTLKCLRVFVFKSTTFKTLYFKTLFKRVLFIFYLVFKSTFYFDYLMHIVLSYSMCAWIYYGIKRTSVDFFKLLHWNKNSLITANCNHI